MWKTFGGNELIVIVFFVCSLYCAIRLIVYGGIVEGEEELILSSNAIVKIIIFKTTSRSVEF